MELKITFDDKVIDQIKVIDKDSLHEINQAIKKAAYLIEGTAKQKIQRGPKTGRLYKHGMIKHRASAPGQAPASDTGRLVSSIRNSTQELLAEVGSALKYAQYLEQGTKKMEIRPFLSSALEENTPKIEQLIQQAINNILKP